MNALDTLINEFRNLPGVSKRSAQKMALHLLLNRENGLHKLQQSLAQADADIKTCGECGNLDVTDPCGFCASETRQKNQICVVPMVSDLWALERTKLYKGRYQVLGGLLSAINNVTPSDLRVHELLEQARHTEGLSEVIFALPASVEGASTVHHLIERLQAVVPPSVTFTRLAHGMPMGGHLESLDEGTLAIALSGRGRV